MLAALDVTHTSLMMQIGRFSLRRPDHGQLYWPSGCPGHCATLFRQVCGLLAGSTDAAAIFWYLSMAANLQEFVMFSELLPP